MTSVRVPTAIAVGEGEWIRSYTIENAVTKQVLLEVDFETGTKTQLAPILGGSELKVTFTVRLTSGSGNLKLTTGMQKMTGEDQYWDLVIADFDLGDAYNPNSAATEFSWKKGTFTMICYGKVSQVTRPTNLTLVQLSSATGDVLDSIKPTIVTAAVDQFQNLYDQKEAKLQTLIDSGVDEGYTRMYSNVLNQSKALVNKGYVNEAIALLNAIPTSGEPMGSALQLILLPVIAVAAVAAVIFAFMFLRAKGKNSYYRLVIEDQIKDLEGLTLRASKIDRSMASSLDSVKDRLKRLVGM